MSHTAFPADRARPGTIRRYRKERSGALAWYREARKAFLAADRGRVGRYGVVYAPGTEKLFNEAMDARDEWIHHEWRVREAEKIRAEMAAGTRDRLGRPVAATTR